MSLFDICEEIEIPEDNPFQNDKLNREGTADNLTKIIDAINGNFVMSIDSPWGTGKTTFIKMWKEKLNESGKYKTLYFNAWENDDSGDPLLAIISQMEDIFSKSEDEKDFEKIKSVGKHLLKKGLPIGLKVLTHGLIDLDKVKLEEFDQKQVIDLAGKLGELEFKSYREDKEYKKSFKEALEEFQKKEDEKIIFFIDELDRCRPNFAIETLEKIKHLFDIENYIFVLSMDKKQLSCSIATMYGEKMDSIGYLRRFIDFDYALPKPNKKDYINFLKSKYDLENENTRYFWDYLDKIVELYDFSLRDIDKMFYYLKILLPITGLFDKDKKYNDMYLVSIGIIYSLFVCLKIKKQDEYENIINGDYNANKTEEIVNRLKLRNIELDENKNIYKYFYDTIIKFLKINKCDKKNIYRLAEEETTVGEYGYTNLSYNLADLWDFEKGSEIINNIEFLDDFQLQNIQSLEY